MKQKLLFLLTALCFGFVSGVKADVVETVVINEDFNDGTTTLFTNASRIAISNDHNAKFYTDHNSTNGYSLATYNFSSAIGEDATAVKIEFAYWIPNSNASYFRYFTLGQANLRTGFGAQSYSTSGAMFGMGLKRGKWQGSGSNVNYFSVNNGYTSQTGTNVLGAWARVEVYIDFSTKKISYKITNVTNTSTYFEADDVDYMDNNATYCNQIDFFDCANNQASYLDNLVITKYVDQSKVATTYTVKYQNSEGTDLKDPVVYDTYVGDTYTASSSDMGTFYSVDTNKKYIYKSGNTSTEATSTAASNVITLVFDEYAKVAYTVTAKNGGTTLGTLSSGNAYTDGSIKVYWNKFKNYNDQWYETTADYGKAISEAGNSDVAYDASDIDYFFEFEDLNISSSYNNPTGDARFSNGAAKTLGASGANAKTTSAIAAGVYTISMYGIKWDNKADNYRVSYSTNGTDWVTLGDISYSSSEEGLKSLSGAIIPTASYIKFETTNGSQTPRRYMDYITFEKTADLPATVSKTITSAKWATYCSPYILDLEHATGLTDAYIVTGGNAGVLAMTSVKGGTVPANTGLLLKGDAGTVTIPVAASSSTNVDDNKLVGVTSNTQLPAEEGYVLMASPKLGFYKNANAFTVGANTAYLPIDFDDNDDNNTSARSAFFGFEEDPTAINAIEATETEAGALKDGKYLIGNKIVLVKNGMKYDANGKKLN